MSSAASKDLVGPLYVSCSRLLKGIVLRHRNVEVHEMYSDDLDEAVRLALIPSDALSAIL